jgi:hypothetical protein
MVLCFVELALLCPGCALVGDGAHLLAYRTHQSVSDCLERQRDRRWAEDAWDKTRCSSSGQDYSADYARGFKDGFADYLYEGGTGEPPLVAPKHYRALRYQTAMGYVAVQDWFAGYRHGASVARQSGFRQLVTVAASLPPAAAGPLPPAQLGQPAGVGPAPEPGEILPPPREVAPGPEDKKAPPPAKGAGLSLMPSPLPYQTGRLPPAYGGPAAMVSPAGGDSTEQQALPAAPTATPTPRLELPAFPPYRASSLPPAYTRALDEPPPVRPKQPEEAAASAPVGAVPMASLPPPVDLEQPGNLPLPEPQPPAAEEQSRPEATLRPPVAAPDDAMYNLPADWLDELSQ